MKTENNPNKNITTFNEHLDTRYGKIGTIKRTEFEIKAKTNRQNKSIALLQLYIGK